MSKVKEFSKKTNRDGAHKLYLQILNGLLGLTNKELDVAARFYHYDEELSHEVASKKLKGELLFSRAYKTKIRNDLGITYLLLNNYITNLKKKGIILEDGVTKYLNDKLDISTKNRTIEVKFNLYLDEEQEHGT